jgi:hypothetical protein
LHRILPYQRLDRRPTAQGNAQESEDQENDFWSTKAGVHSIIPFLSGKDPKKKRLPLRLLIETGGGRCSCAAWIYKTGHLLLPLLAGHRSTQMKQILALIGIKFLG